MSLDTSSTFLSHNQARVVMSDNENHAQHNHQMRQIGENAQVLHQPSTQRVTTVDGVVTAVSDGYVTSADLQAPSADTDDAWLNEAKSKAGFPVPRDRIDEKSVVKMAGMETSIGALMALGLVTKTASGEFVRAEQHQESADPSHDDGSVVFDQDTELSIDSMYTAFEQSGLADSLINNLMAAEVEVADIVGINDTLAAAGFQRDAGLQQLQAIRSQFVNQAVQHVTERGADAEAFYRWAAVNHKTEFNQAKRQHIYGRNPNSYDALLAKFQVTHHSNVDPHSLPEGYELSDVRGVQVVTIPGLGQFRASEARKLGLL